MSFNPIPVAGVELENCNGLKVSEKGRTDQCGQLEQADYELGQTKRNLSSLEKKYQATEAMLTEKTSADQENTHVIDTMKRRMADYTSQISDLKSEKEDDLKLQKDLRNKIKSLENTAEEYDHDKEVAERRSQELTRQITKLQEQLEAANISINDLNTSVETANARSDKSHKDLILAMEKHAAALAGKDDEIEIVKKTCRGTIYLLKGQIENSDMEAAKMNMINKDLGQEIILLQGDLDEAEATIRELNNEIPRQQDILEQLNMSLTESSTRVEALQEALIRADMKSSLVGDRNDELEGQLKQSEMQMRLTEQDNIDLHNKISEHQGKSQSLLDTLAKLETRLEEQSEAFEAMENDKSDWEIEKRKMKEIVSSLESDNQLLEETKMSLENSECKLKARIRDIMSEGDEALSHQKNSSRTKIRVLESKVAELEGLLEEETEKRTDADKALKKMERSLKEFEMQAEETSQSLERQMEQITSLSGRNKQLKSQFADSEARVTSLQARLRKVLSEVEESENRNATMTKMLSTPAASRCSTPASSFRQSAMMRNSVLSSRCSSRLISPEVEHIIMSGRNSPMSHLSILSGRNSPNPTSPLIRAESPNSPGKLPNNVFDFETTQPTSGGAVTTQEVNGKTSQEKVVEGVPDKESGVLEGKSLIGVAADSKSDEEQLPKQRLNDIITTVNELGEDNVFEEPQESQAVNSNGSGD